MLTNLDDYPIHQFAEPMRSVGTSDRNFYDRYYFMGFEHGGSAMFIAGLGVYPNLGVIDGFVAVMVDGHFQVVRASQELELSDRLNPSVGPISVDVVEALKTLRVRCEPNEWGIEFDCTFTGAHEPFEEPRHSVREQGRVIFDTTRLAQTGTWSGALTAPDRNGTLRTFDVNDTSWWGTRDRSWGVRPIGESEPQGIRAKKPFSWFWIYTPVKFDDHTLLVMMQEHQDGSRVLEEAVRMWPAETGKPHEFFSRPRHQMQFEPGTRFSTGARIQMDRTDDDGAVIETLDVLVEPIIPVHIGIGTGYGYDADWRHGMWQGAEPVVQGFQLDTQTPEGKARLFGIVDNGAKFTYHDSLGSHTGYGLYENMIIGPHDQYGFTDMLDGYSGVDTEVSS
ncbi:MAG: hypothetical protein ABIR32_12020 [Ilumatobacteraceae bacterium]